MLHSFDPDAVMAVFSADQLIDKPGRYRALLKPALRAADQGEIAVLGIQPRWPETGFGYIRTGEALAGDTFKAGAFVEKPDRATAQSYLESGDYLWNSGMFVWKAESILDEIKLLMPPLYKGLKKIWGALGTPEESGVVAAEFKKMKSVSIDYGVMEKSSRVAIVPVDFGWSDLGSWDAIDEILPPDKDGNVTLGKVVSVGCKNTTFYAEDRLVAAIGLDGLVVVDTPDATLVCRKDRTQEVKDIVGLLKDKGFNEYLSHRTVQRPWGSYTVLQTGPMFKIKRIEVKPGASLSCQMHHHRSEHWIVVAGTALVTNGDKKLNVHVNESTFIPMSTMHRLENPGKVPLQIIEVQNGEYLEEDDIVRFDDVYGRC
jgi:mannose-1-phosphate guanylyltransferase/mannose-6-phosphate isomerase